MICIQPTDTRFVEIHHRLWDLRWAIQFPEGIHSDAGTAMTWQAIHPEWQRTGSGAWGYDWRTTREYIDSLHSNDKSKFTVGLALRADIETVANEVHLSLTLTNETKDPLDNVQCDGGCLQARSDAFTDNDEVARSSIMIGDAMVGMGGLHRTIPERCNYCCDHAAYESDMARQYEYFWGRSTEIIDEPAIIGAVSADGDKAVVMGYQCARSGLQNADDHHCLHSRPNFGRIEPGQSVTRLGYVIFGTDLNQLATDLKPRIT